MVPRCHEKRRFAVNDDFHVVNQFKPNFIAHAHAYAYAYAYAYACTDADADADAGRPEIP
jgi:hypothetical protein